MIFSLSYVDLHGMFSFALRLVHYLYIFGIDIHADLLSDIMLIVILQKPFNLAVLTLYKHLIVDSDEEF